MRGGRRGFRVRAGPRAGPSRSKVTKKCQNRAEITALMESNKSFSLQRLMRDFNEIKNQPVPLPGISALPLDDDFFVWHGNIKSIAQNIYKGMVLHFEFRFNAKYPLEAPTITLLNRGILHPNIMSGGSVCLDMLTKSNEPYKGWKSGYSILSILLQLQTFFFEVDESFIKKQDLEAMKEALIAANEFRCHDCKHKGSSNPFPEFLKASEDLEQFKLSPEEYRKAKKSELVCFHRKTTFEETPLGLGITVSKVRRTGEIKGVVPCLEFVSLKSYTKEKIRNSLEGERFTYWFPLFFNHKPEKFLPSCTKAISMIFKGNTKEFNEKMILKVMPKFFNNVVLNIVTEKTHNSSRVIQIMLYLYRICIMLIQNYSGAREELETSIENFIKDEKCRVKDYTSSLGDLLVMMSLSSKHKIEELLASYMNEQMDRQILWIIQEIPALERLINAKEIDDIRGKVCFKTGLAGNQLLLFYYYFLKKMVYADCKSIDEFAVKLDKNWCNLSDEEIDKHRVEISKILKIDNFGDYYKYMGLTPPTDKTLNEMLKQSFVNSKNKGYHGNDEVRFVPNEKTEAETYLKKLPSITEFVKEKALLPATDPKWREMLERFDYVSHFKYQHPNEEITPLSIIHYENINEKDQIFFNEQSKADAEKKLETMSRNKYALQNTYVKPRDDDVIISSLNWKQVYLKLYIEEYLKYFSFTTDFKYLYQLLDLAHDDIIHLNFKILGLGKLKSEFNYIRAVLSKLTKLKYLCFTFYEDINIKMLKNIMKGLTNSSKEDNEIIHLKIVKNQSGSNYSTRDLTILTMLDKLPSLKILDLSDLPLTINDALRIRNHLYYFKKLEHVDLTNCSINDEMAKEIADGIMKAKNLEYLFLGNNLMNKNLSTILYNIAFQPSIKVIDISENKSIDLNETATAIYKLLKMSQTIETLICKNISGLNPKLPKDFYVSMGDNSNLSYLDLSHSGNINYTMLAQAIAFNALKNGSLKKLKLDNTSINWSSFESMVNSLEICESDHVNWYGFQLNSNTLKNSTDYYAKTFYCNLQHISLNNSTLQATVNIHDPKNSYYTNPVKKLLSKALKLEALSLNNCILSKQFYEMLVDGLQNMNQLKHLQLSSSGMIGDSTKAFMNVFKSKDKKTMNNDFKLISLDLSMNNFGYSGIELLSQELKTNTTIKYLNLYHNMFDVNGARRFEEAVKTNATLEEVDIGYNRIKDVGFSAIMAGIKANKNSKIKDLSVKYNFIRDKCFLEHMKALIASPSDYPIKRINMKNNSISEETLSEFYKNEFVKSKTLTTDLFELLYYLIPERLERTVWMNCSISATKKELAAQIKEKDTDIRSYIDGRLGRPLYIRRIRGRKVGQKKTAGLSDCFVEFMLPNSANRILKIASTHKFSIAEKNLKVFKAGTKPDYLVVKKKNLR